MNLPPGLPSYIIFMCIRYADSSSDDEDMDHFLSSISSAIRRVVKRSEDFETSVLWLVNTCRLLHCLKQYSGEKVCAHSLFICHILVQYSNVLRFDLTFSEVSRKQHDGAKRTRIAKLRPHRLSKGCERPCSSDLQGKKSSTRLSRYQK